MAPEPQTPLRGERSRAPRMVISRVNGRVNRRQASSQVSVSHQVKPRALKPGDTVGVVSPASAIDREHLERGVAALARWAFGSRSRATRSIGRQSWRAPTPMRASELQAFFADPEVNAIFAARGGYGAGRILPLLDFDAIARTPKVFMGFSDATFLLNALVETRRDGMLSRADGRDGFCATASASASLDHLRRLLAARSRASSCRRARRCRPGIAEGEVIGGCLSMVVATIGTPFAPPFDGAILFLEDTGEKAYRIDRMLVQLAPGGRARTRRRSGLRRDAPARRQRGRSIA